MKKISQNLSLAFQLARRDVAARYRGSLLGMLWSFINPLLLLAVYGVVFSMVFHSRWGNSNNSGHSFPLILFSGLILHALFAECMMRGPSIILHNANYVKKVVFPLDILPLTVVFSAIFHFLISFIVLLIGVFLITGAIPYTVLYLPVVILPFMLFLCGASWLLASVGVFLRDISQVMGLVCTVALFISPVFYPISSAPVFLQQIIYLNPLSIIVDNFREIIIYGNAPDFAVLEAYTLSASGIFLLGYFWFAKTRKGFADVIEIAVKVTDISKDYLVYGKPQHRLWQFLLGGLKKFYRHFHALKNISLEVKKGEIIGIVGRNGSGKSTLLQIICGTLQPSAGNIVVNGRISALLELGAGFNPEFTGIENIYLSGAIMGMDKKDIRQKYDSIVKFANIGEHINQPVKTYSSGMYVRLAFAVAVASDPDILVIDEALAVGDEAFQRKCFSRIREIRERGGTIIFVSHSAKNIIELCDRAFMLDAGEVIMAGNPKAVIANYHKFIFAPQEKRGTIRTALQKGKVFKGDDVMNTDEQPESTVEYESRGAVISGTMITNKKHKKVNQLKRGEEYIFTYKVKFTEDCKGVRCGMLIKTASGIELGGSTTAKDKDVIKLAKKGSTLKISFKFKASLLPGTYFLNCGSSGIVDGERVFLHRIYDACMFKIMAEANLRENGIIDFAINPVIKPVKGR